MIKSVLPFSQRFFSSVVEAMELITLVNIKVFWARIRSGFGQSRVCWMWSGANNILRLNRMFKHDPDDMNRLGIFIPSSGDITYCCFGETVLREGWSSEVYIFFNLSVLLVLFILGEARVLKFFANSDRGTWLAPTTRTSGFFAALLWSVRERRSDTINRPPKSI